jgi:molybdate transport system permease protein
MIGSALLLSLKLAITTSIILLLIGLPLARWIAFSKNRFKFIIEALVALPIVLPPTVLGFYLLVALGQRSPLGALWISWTGHPLAFSFAGLVIGSVLYSLPFAVQPFAASFASVDPALLQASATLGASSFRTFRQVVLPLSMSGIITGVVLSFAHTLGEFGVVLMIGGNIPGVTQTVSIAIYDHVEALEYSAANQAALLLLVISFVMLALVYSINRKVLRVWPFE